LSSRSATHCEWRRRSPSVNSRNSKLPALTERQDGQISTIQDQKIEHKVPDARGFGCEMLKTVKVWSAGLVQRYDFAVNNSVGGKISERLQD